MTTIFVTAGILFALWCVRIAWQVLNLPEGWDWPECNKLDDAHFWLAGEKRCRCGLKLIYESPWHTE